MNSPNATRWACFVRSGMIPLLLSGLATAEQGDGECAPKQGATPLKSAGRSEWKLKEPEDALKRAGEVLGVEDRTAVRMEAKLIVRDKDNIPYLSGQVVGRPLWLVTVHEWRLRLPTAPGVVEDVYVRTFDVWVEPVEGRLLRIASRWPEGEVPMAPEPSAAAATDEISRSGSETYHGFPDTGPTTTLLVALDGMQRRGPRPLAARQIGAHYVLWSAYNIKYRVPRPVWAITLRGEPPLLPPPGSTTEPRFQNRYIVDAETGKFLCATNIPVPEKAGRVDPGEPQPNHEP
jgi:hypothetical protein